MDWMVEFRSVDITENDDTLRHFRINDGATVIRYAV